MIFCCFRCLSLETKTTEKVEQKQPLIFQIVSSFDFMLSSMIVKHNQVMQIRQPSIFRKHYVSTDIVPLHSEKKIVQQLSSQKKLNSQSESIFCTSLIERELDIFMNSQLTSKMYKKNVFLLLNIEKFFLKCFWGCYTNTGNATCDF